MIISKTPFRISFVGGGSDLKEFYKEEGEGSVLSTSINKYMYLSMHDYFYTDRYFLKYSQTEVVNNVNDIKHDIIREVFRYFNIESTDFNSTADIPAGTGMGSSSAFTCGLINLCATKKKLRLTNFEIARIACEIEIDILKEPIGKQDQYGCAIGGINLITFKADEKVEIKTLSMEQNNILSLENNLYLYYTSTTRKASSILTEQKARTNEIKSVRENLRTMSNMAKSLFDHFMNGEIDILGEYLHEAWQIKKELSNGISNQEIDQLYNFGLANGATGGKLLGAGGGGFILFYVPLNKKEKFLHNMNIYKRLDFQFDFEGTKIIYNN
jgi:D-glycero-alpha-D-manno-heptose-7-phosphate kinase